MTVKMVYENDFDAHLIWLTSATVSFCLALTVITCVCGCRKRVPKNELLGLAGLVKITNPDENVNFRSSSANVQLNTVSVSTNDLNSESLDSNKRGHNAVATATRSLPDLPIDSGETAEKLWCPTENNVDTNSDLYATVEDAGRKKRPVTSGLTVDSTYTASQTDDSLSPYARLRGEHPYDQLQKNEHPYAQVGTNGNNAIPSTSTEIPTASPASVQTSTPSRRGTEPPDREETTKSPSLNEVPDEIPAASAIAGSVPANHDLPYMTPPIPVQQPQQHFSGDSVDSSKGYTSISVREPLSRILANRRNGSGIMDPHYATVSDDSDEMYAAIEERQSSQLHDSLGAGEYTSGSETYAQINQPHTSLGSANPTNHPPNLSLILHHQDSVSTCSSDSPRRERRVANSPLPQVPALDEMYAKVNKKGRSPTSPEPPDNSQVLRRSSQVVDDEQSSLPGYEMVNSSDPNYEELQPSPCGEPDYASLSRHYHHPSGFNDTNYEPTYETARFPPSTYELGSLTDPNYECVGSSNEPPYERVNSIPPEPPDYEVVCSRVGQPLTSVTDLYAQNLRRALNLNIAVALPSTETRSFHTTNRCDKKQAGRYKKSPKGDRPLTYEMSYAPHHIAHLKSWNSWNTSNLQGGIRPAETLFEDVFIRKFLEGTWHRLFLSEIIVKRQHNIIRIAGIVHRALTPQKFYFLIGYTEELLSYWLQCPVKLELQTVADRKDIVFKYI